MKQLQRFHSHYPPIPEKPSDFETFWHLFSDFCRLSLPKPALASYLFH